MRKNTKSNLYSSFTPIPYEKINFGTNQLYVVDGGFLLHKVPFKKGEQFCTIFKRYVSFVTKRYDNCIVVFDGYPDDATQSGTKMAERSRRANAISSTYVELEEDMILTSTKKVFIGNEKNKKRFIEYLKKNLLDAGIQVLQAKEDADTTIVREALKNAENYDSCIVIGEDVDLLVLLIGLGFSYNNVYLLKPGKSAKQNTYYSSKSLNANFPAELILVLHGFTGCDTTSAMYFKGKNDACKLLEKHQILQNVVETFLLPNQDKEKIIKQGEIFIKYIYGNQNNEDSLNECRYQCFVKSATNIKFDLRKLPPTSEGAKLHSLRVYLQVQTWQGQELNPEEWGWFRSKSGLLPLTLEKEDQALPDDILNMISCKCKKGCTAKCSCRKSGFKCSLLCSICNGKDCENSAEIDEIEELVSDQPDLNIESENVIDETDDQSNFSETDSECSVGNYNLRKN